MRKWGWKRDLPDFRDFKYSEHAEYLPAPPLPALVDLRPILSPIEDQGQLGSCVAHAVCGALEFLELQEIKKNIKAAEYFGPTFDPISRLFVYYNARDLDGDPHVDGGTQIRSAISVIQSDGICNESLWPYDPLQIFIMPTIEAYAEGEQHKVLFSYKIDNLQLNAMQQCLDNGFPFVFGISVFDSFLTPEVARTGIVPMPDASETCQGGHALCAVGYDDSKKAFIVRNSWGINWGLKGYCYIPYEYLNNPGLCSDCWTLRKLNQYTEGVQNESGITSAA